MFSTNFFNYKTLLILLIAFLLSCKKEKAKSYVNEDKHLDSISYFLQKGNSNYTSGRFDSAFFYDKKLFKYANSKNDLKNQANSLFNIGFYFDETKKNPDSALYYYSRSIHYWKKLKDSLEVTDILRNMAIIQKNRNDYYGAKEILTEALKNLPYKGNHRNTEAVIYDQLGNNNKRLFNYADAIAYHKKAIKTTESEIARMSYKNNLAMTLFESNDFKGAIKILNTLVTDSIKKIKPTFYARVLHNLEYAKWKNDNSEKPENFFKALKIRNSKNDLEGLIASHTDLAEYLLKDRPNISKKHIDTVIRLSKKIKRPQAELDALELLMQLEPTNIAIRNRFILIKDSLYRVELNVKTQFAKLVYDDQLKNEAIQQLELETLKKNNEIKEQQLQKVIFIILSIFLLITAITMYFLVKERNKKQQLQAIFATERRLSKKIHDELANEVYGVMNNIQFEKSQKKEKLLDRLELIYNKTRDISKSYNKDISELHFTRQLKDLLGEYQNHTTSIVVKGLDKKLFIQFPSHKKETLFLVLQEIMINMKKHSKAQLVLISFTKTSKEIIINYKDNGMGVNLEKQQKNGIENMETRIHDIKGRFIFVSEPGKGVKITISVPH